MEMLDQMEILRNTLNNVSNENFLLKNKIVFTIGALEGINYLLKNDDPQINKENIDHLRSTVSRVLNDLRSEI